MAATYLDALELELSWLGESYSVETIFIGGGTPTHLPPMLLERMLTIIQRWLPLANDGEWSIESTPDSLDAKRVQILADHGVNRVSIGVQSFRDESLRVLDRHHRPEDIAPAIESVRKRIDNVSLDLIFGVPGQTLSDWRADLAQALALEPNHISCYGLTFEKGTPLDKQRQSEQVQPLDEEIERQMFLDADDVLSRLGYEHYEISNYARPGYQCRHNETYWSNEAYHGFGLGAARYIHGKREMNTRSLDVYLSRISAGWSPTIQSEQLPPRERALETLTVQLRRSIGVNRPEFRSKTGIELDSVVGQSLSHLVNQELLVDDGENVRLTREGMCVADAILVQVWQKSETSPTIIGVTDALGTPRAHATAEPKRREPEID
jgi:putative oxygen-independent coproporphyrinogen III oxidase